MKVIRGSRIADQLDQVNEDSTYAALERNTLAFNPPSKRRQHEVNPQQVSGLQLLPAQNALIVKGDVRSDSGQVYSPSMLFTQVEYEDTDELDNITFAGPDGKEYHIQSIDLRTSTVKVRCTCLDFYHRFAPYNAGDGSLYGNPPPPYRRKTTTRPPANARKTPGVCKHLMKLTVVLKDSDVVR